MSLLEVLIAAAVAAIVCAAAFVASASSHPGALRSAVTQFDAALAYGQALASSSSSGATMTITSSQITVYSGRPASNRLRQGALAPAGIAGVTVRETTAGAAPIAILLDGSGHAGITPYNGATPGPAVSPPPCPAARQWVLTFSQGRTTIARTLSCSVPIGGAPAIIPAL